MENKFINVNEAYEYHDIACWYQNSVDETPPIWTDEHLEELLNDFYVIPKDTPTVDIVRCKDCKHCDKYTKWNNKEYLGCNFNCDITEVAAEHYCSYGERRTEDD